MIKKYIFRISVVLIMIFSISIFLYFRSFYGIMFLYHEAIRKNKEIKTYYQPFIVEIRDNYFINLINEGVCMWNIFEYSGFLQYLNDSVFLDCAVQTCVYIPADFEKVDSFFEYLKSQNLTIDFYFIQQSDKKYYDYHFKENKVLFINHIPFIETGSKPVFFQIDKSMVAQNVFISCIKKIQYNNFYFMAIKSPKIPTTPGLQR